MGDGYKTGFHMQNGYIHQLEDVLFSANMPEISAQPKIPKCSVIYWSVFAHLIILQVLLRNYNESIKPTIPFL